MRFRTNSTSDLRAEVRICQILSSEVLRTSFSKHSVVPNQRDFPQDSVHNSSACLESQLGIWTPLVTCPIGTSSSDQRGNKGAKRCRLTFPWRRLTPLMAPL